MTDKPNNNTRSRTTKSRRSRKQKSRWKTVLKWTGVGLLTILLSLGALFAYYAKDAPNITQEQLQSGGSSSLYDAKGELIISLGSEKRDYVSSQDIPQQLKDAVISVEDRRFYQEKFGVDPIRIVSSVFSNVQSGGISSGGSTITQQLVKLTVFDTTKAQQTLRRKAQEAWLAMKVEQKYSKEQILEFYINKVYMNYGLSGMQTASNYYYGKPLSELSLAQTALIAGMPNAPVTFDPYKNPEKAKERRDIVLYAMYKNEKISKSDYEAAVNVAITDGLVAQDTTVQSTERKIFDPYIKEVVNELKDKGYDPYNDNLKITVNMDVAAQRKLYELVNDGSVQFSSDKMQVGASIVDPTTGQVVAIIGGRNLPDVQLGLNRAVQTARSSGSTIKPLLDYGPAIEYLDWPTSQTVKDTKYIYPGTNIQLYDWDSSYLGNMTMRKALVQSRNVPAVRTLEEVGLSKASQFIAQMGITIPDTAGLSVGIGADASSLQLASAYAAFANGGNYYAPTFVSKVESQDGTVKEFDSEAKKVMKESTAYMITDMLKGVFTDPLATGTTAKIAGLYEAGKSGTVKYSDEELAKYPNYDGTPKDAWFNGYTKAYSMSIWTGYDQLSDGAITGVGEYASQNLYKQMMSYLMQNKANTDWTMPSTVERVTLGGVSQLFLKGTAPSTSITNSGNSSTNNANQQTSSSSSSVMSSSSSSSSSIESSSSSSSSVSQPESSSSSSSSSSSVENPTVTPPADNNATP